uniref:Ribosome biogenesis protein SLX9 n=1 Tax=Mycena chlorophos TaxID=658473 RepID=A0ABQ0LHU4_MYCCL|nr:predicted protein [Mycena chlorophos]
MDSVCSPDTTSAQLASLSASLTGLPSRTPHGTRHLRPLLPRPACEAREEPFVVRVTPRFALSYERPKNKKTSTRHVPARADTENTVWLLATTAVHRRDRSQPATPYERRSAGQKRRREREARERRENPPQVFDARRSAAQRARRQRELAAEIQANLRIPQYSDERAQNGRSIAQSLRRKVEKANRMLDEDPDCDTTESLTKALWDEHDANNTRRE